MYTYHFKSDSPIELDALFFVGEQHQEKFGLGRQQPGVDLYSRKVLIESATKVMPEWLRFLHGTRLSSFTATFTPSSTFTLSLASTDTSSFTP